MTRRRWVLAGLVAAALLGLLAATGPADVRVGLALVGCLLLPGLGWARKLGFGDRGDTLGLAVALSMCSTVAVGTVMAVSAHWSLGLGLLALAVITGLGFVPMGALADRASAAAQRRIGHRFGDDGGAWSDWYDQTQQQAAQHRHRAVLATADATAAWMEWYATAERQADVARSEQVVAAQEATDDWIGWFHRTHLLTPRRDEEGTRDE